MTNLSARDRVALTFGQMFMETQDLRAAFEQLQAECAALKTENQELRAKLPPEKPESDPPDE